jgi:hypothetical protein
LIEDCGGAKGTHHIEEPGMTSVITCPGVIVGGDGVSYVNSDGRLFARG